MTAKPLNPTQPVVFVSTGAKKLKETAMVSCKPFVIAKRKEKAA